MMNSGSSNYYYPPQQSNVNNNNNNGMNTSGVYQPTPQPYGAIPQNQMMQQSGYINNNNMYASTSSLPPSRGTNTTTTTSNNTNKNVGSRGNNTQQPPRSNQQPVVQPSQPQPKPIPSTMIVGSNGLPSSYGSQPVMIVPSSQMSFMPPQGQPSVQQADVLHTLVQTLQQHLEQTKQWKQSIDEQIQYMDMKLSAILTHVKKMDASSLSELEQYERFKNKNVTTNSVTSNTTTSTVSQPVSNTQPVVNTNSLNNNNLTNTQNTGYNQTPVNNQQVSLNSNLNSNMTGSFYANSNSIPPTNNIPNTVNNNFNSQDYNSTYSNQTTPYKTNYYKPSENVTPSYSSQENNNQGNYYQQNRNIDNELDELDKELTQFQTGTITSQTNIQPEKDFSNDIALICKMGFSELEAKQALQRFGDRGSAINYLLDQHQN